MRTHTRNNFDLLRLGAALQVVIYHVTLLLGLRVVQPLHAVLDAFPGVPIFFVISGFLISGSLLRGSSLRSYARNRVLRIYPALWVCFAFTAVVVVMSGVIGVGFLLTPRGLAWVGSQLILATGTPDAVRGFGSGTPNASLWTIGVELQFYVLLALLLRWRSASVRVARSRVLAVALVSVACALASALLAQHGQVRAVRLLDATAAPHFWIFSVGVLARLEWARLAVVRAHPILWVGVALGWSVLVTQQISSSPMRLVAGVPGLVLLGAAVLSLAHARPGLAHRVLREQDISYGLYLYHFVIVNCALGFGWGRGYDTGLLIGLLAVVAASLSWVLVERPALALKSRPLPLQGVRRRSTA